MTLVNTGFFVFARSLCPSSLWLGEEVSLLMLSGGEGSGGGEWGNCGEIS